MLVPGGRGSGVRGTGRSGDRSSDSAADDGGSARGRKALTARNVIAVGIVIACVVVASVAYALTQQSAPSSSPAARAQAGGRIRVVSVIPAANASQVNGSAPVVVTFSAPIAASSPDPMLQPAVAGKWSVDGDSMFFTATSALAPSTRETVQVPGGPSGVRSSAGGHLTATVSDHFTTAPYSQLRLAQLLGQLGYLPLTWSPVQASVGAAAPVQEGAGNSTEPALAYSPPDGSFTWLSDWQSMLGGLWSPNQPNVIIRGAVMAFESEHGMAINGDVTPKLWTALFNAEARDQHNKNGYTYAIANKGSPETLTIWHDGREVLRSLANTGIPVSPTVDGTFPVYLRYRFQVMTGFNPDGSYYADPVDFVSYFNGGDAVHYFPRGSYGFPQSLGCVELPWNDAEQAWPYLTYGSLVSVTG